MKKNTKTLKRIKCQIIKLRRTFALFVEADETDLKNLKITHLFVPNFGWENTIYEFSDFDKVLITTPVFGTKVMIIAYKNCVPSTLKGRKIK